MDLSGLARLPVPISLTRSGIPRIVRRDIMRRDSRANSLVQLSYLSFFSLSKLIPLAKPVTRSTFESMVTPVPDLSRVISFVSNKYSSKDTDFVRSIGMHRLSLLFRLTRDWSGLPLGRIESTPLVRRGLQEECDLGRMIKNGRFDVNT